MKLARVLCSLSLAALAIAGPRLFPQANVVENQAAVLYVDAQSGSDSNSGSASSPFKTIQAAVNKANTNNQKSIGTKIVVNPGVYRETVNIDPVTGLTTVPLTIEAATNGTAIIAASNLLNGWSTDSENPGAYVTNWTPTQSTCALPSGWPAVQKIALHTEMLFVNSIAMTQVLSYSDLKPGTFFVNASDGTLHLWPPSGVDPSSSTVEVASRVKTISVVSRKNIVLRGLVFEHAANCINTSGATVTSSSNVLIDSVQANWNNFGGLGISSSSNVTVQNSIASYNGGVGFQGTRGQTTLYTNNETDYNNWRGAQSAFYNWASGGAKFFQMRSTTVQGHSSYNNQAQGLWFDTDNKNITIDNATLVGSYNAALQLERNEGPVLLENSHLCASGVGVNVLTTQGLTVNNNVFYNNGATNKYQAQFYLAGSAGGINITDWQTGQVYNLITTGTVMNGNSFMDELSGQFVFGTYLSGTDWTDFTSTLKSGNNAWFDPNTASAFHIVNGKNVNLSGWQSATGADYNSTWGAPAATPSSACAVPAPAYPDFNVSLDNGSYTMSSGRATGTVRVNSFNFGAVNLSVSGLPSGVTASFSTPSLTSGYSILSLTSSSTTSTQTVPVTLWAISGDRVHSVTFNLTVNANPAVVGTTTALSSSASTVNENSSVTLTATVRQASGTTTPTGSVTFYNGASAIGTATLSSGTATLSTSSLPVGSNSLTAVYAGTSTFNASTSSAIAVTVNSSAIGTTTTLAASATSIAQNSSVTLTATVKPASGTTTPTGTVTFYNGSASIGSAALSAGVASLSVSTLPVGTDSITAVYSGTTSLNSSTSNGVVVTVSSSVTSTTTVLASSSTSIAQNSPVTLTATVTQSSGTATPTGSVTFYNGSASIGTAALSGGTAILSTSSLPTGTNSISAAYSGGVAFNASSSNIVVITVNAAASTAVKTATTLSASGTKITQNSPVTFTATVKPSSGTSTPTGTVTFYNGSTSIGSASLNVGTATLTTSALPVGTDTISAAYVGTSAFSGSASSAIFISVNSTVIGTTTTLASSSSSVAENTPVTLTATIKATGGTNTPTGTVTFYNGSAAIGSAALSSGAASISTAALPVGSQSITATYAGSATFGKSSSNAVSITVKAKTESQAIATSTAIASSAPEADQGYTISLTATVSASGASLVPTGTVDFAVGSRKIGAATLSNGKAYLRTASLPVGSNAITAAYTGNGSFAPSNSKPITIKISGPDFTVEATPSTVTITPGQSVSIALLITPKNGFDQVPVLTCSGLPAGSTCSFGTLAKQSDGTAVVTMTIRTAPLTAELQQGPSLHAPFALAFLPLLLWISARRRKEFRALLGLPVLFAALLILGGGAMGCGGRASLSSTQTTAASSTVNITVNAQTSSGLNHTASVTLKIR